MATRINECRICGKAHLEDILSLGNLPPVNSFLSGPADIAREQKHPLAIAFCSTCSHVQLTHMLDPKDIFEDYIYFSGMSETVVRWGHSLAERYAKELALKPTDLVGELASNDGVVLKPFKAHARIQGVEPAKNIAEVANKDSVPTRAEFFNSQLGKTLRDEVGPARLIIARNVLAHVPKVVDFVVGVKNWLADDGIFHIEAPYAAPMVKHLEFDQIYHEHLSYFTVTALDRLAKEAGMVLWDVEEIALHGGSIIARMMKKGPPTGRVGAALEREKKDGLTTLAPWKQFAAGTQKLKTELPTFLHDLKKKGGKLAAYGAAAKGVVLTNYCDIGTDLLEWVADRSPYKQGKLTPGKHIPVVPAEEVLKRKPDYLLVLAWNFFDEIKKQQAAYAKAGGKFVLPVPAPRVEA